MNKTLSFIGLDFVTIKPYLTLKNMAIFLITAAVFTFMNQDSMTAVGILMMYCSLYATYPFSIGEKNGLDGLYTCLGVGRKTVVLGRYLFGIVINLFACIVAFVFAVLIGLFTNITFDLATSLFTILIIFTLSSIIQFIQYPFYFKLGYEKAKMFSYLSYLALPLIIILAVRFSESDTSAFAMERMIFWMRSNLIIVVIMYVVTWIVLMFVSYLIAVKNYQKRDL